MIPLSGHIYRPSPPHNCISMSYPLPVKAGVVVALNIARQGKALAHTRSLPEADTTLFRAPKSSNLPSLNTPLTLSKGPPLNTVNQAISPLFISITGREHPHARHQHSTKRMLIMLAGGVCWLSGALAIMQVVRLSTWQYRLPGGYTKSWRSVDGPLKLAVKAASTTLGAALAGITVVYGSSLALHWWFPGSVHLDIPAKQTLCGILTSIAAGAGLAMILTRNSVSLRLHHPESHRE